MLWLEKTHPSVYRLRMLLSSLPAWVMPEGFTAAAWSIGITKWLCFFHNRGIPAGAVPQPQYQLCLNNSPLILFEMEEGCLDLKHTIPSTLKDAAPGYRGLHAVFLLLLAECNHHFLISKARKEKQCWEPRAVKLKKKSHMMRESKLSTLVAFSQKLTNLDFQWGREQYAPSQGLHKDLFVSYLLLNSLV